MVSESQEQLTRTGAQGASNSNKTWKEVYQTLDFDKTLKELYQTMDPDIAKEWDYTRSTRSETAYPPADTIVWWSLDKGGDKPRKWQADPSL